MPVLGPRSRYGMFVVDGCWPACGLKAVGFAFTPLIVGLFGPIGWTEPLGVAFGLPEMPVGLFGFSVPGVPGRPAEGVVPAPDGAVVAPDEGAAVPGDGPPAAVCAARGSVAMEIKESKTDSFFMNPISFTILLTL